MPRKACHRACAKELTASSRLGAVAVGAGVAATASPTVDTAAVLEADPEVAWAAGAAIAEGTAPAVPSTGAALSGCFVSPSSRSADIIASNNTLRRPGPYPSQECRSAGAVGLAATGAAVGAGAATAVGLAPGALLKLKNVSDTDEMDMANSLLCIPAHPNECAHGAVVGVWSAQVQTNPESTCN